MPSCVFRWCTNYKTKVNKAQGVTYHSFPADEIRLQEWIEIVRIQRSECDWTPSKSSTICSIHFNSNDTYVTKKGLIQLKKQAIPIIEQSEIQDIKNSPRSSLDGESTTPDIKHIVEPPITKALKKRVRELIFKKKQTQKRNKILFKQNERLKKSAVALAVILKDLQKKNYISKARFLRSKLKFQVID